jgi:hypothetical protein
MRVASLTSAPTEWDLMLETAVYRMKVKLNPTDRKKVILVYTLKKDVPLPYSPVIPVFVLFTSRLWNNDWFSGVKLNITFSKMLVPEIEGQDGRKVDDTWIYEGIDYIAKNGKEI